MCAACKMEKEDVKHYLLKCPRYDTHRLKMQQHYRRYTIPKRELLATPGAMKLLFEYVNNTKRFGKTYGTFDIPQRKERRR